MEVLTKRQGEPLMHDDTKKFRTEDDSKADEEYTSRMLAYHFPHFVLLEQDIVNFEYDILLIQSSERYLKGNKDDAARIEILDNIVESVILKLDRKRKEVGICVATGEQELTYIQLLELSGGELDPSLKLVPAGRPKEDFEIFIPLGEQVHRRAWAVENSDFILKESLRKEYEHCRAWHD
jgi:hypothetical protein